MTYRRTVPRDLFNEANLLKCVGQLYLETEGMKAVAFENPQGDEPFIVDQDPADGSLSLANARVLLRGEVITLKRPLNSRQPWPLYATHLGMRELDEEIEVFDNKGKLTPEFFRLLRSTAS